MKTPLAGRPRALRAALALVILGTVTLVAPSPASADWWSDVDTSYARTNEVRAWQGQGPLAWDDNLAIDAQWWAEQLAWQGRLRHNPWLADEMWGWWSWGENVGTGPSIHAVQDAWYWSWHHWANMVNPAYTSIGIGIAYGHDGQVYAVQVFGG